MLNTKINVEKTAGREPASKTIVGGMFSSLKGKMGFSSSDRQIQARKLVIQDALNKAYSEFEIDNLRCLSDIKSEADALAYNHSVPLASVASKVRELAFNRRTPFRSQMIDLCEDAGVEEFVVNNVKSTLDVFEDAYVVFGLHGLPLVACKVNWFNPESLIELCRKGRVSEVIGRPESAVWGRAFKDPAKYSLSGDMFYDEVLYYLEEKFDSCTSELIANSVLRTSEGMLGGAKMRVVVISSDKPSYVPIADNIKDWGGIAKIVADSLKQLDTNRIQSIRTFPKTRMYAVDLDIELPEDVKPRHGCPHKLRFKVQDWIHGKGAATAEKLPSRISLTWEDIAPHCPDFISQTFSESEILQYLSKRLKWETLESVRKYREWRNSGEKFIPYSGRYYSTDDGVLGLKDEIVTDFVSRSFPNYECIHDVMEEINTPSTYYPFKNLRSLMEHTA